MNEWQIHELPTTTGHLEIVVQQICHKYQIPISQKNMKWRELLESLRCVGGAVNFWSYNLSQSRLRLLLPAINQSIDRAAPVIGLRKSFALSIIDPRVFCPANGFLTDFYIVNSSFGIWQTAKALTKIDTSPSTDDKSKNKSHGNDLTFASKFEPEFAKFNRLRATQ